VSASRAEMNDYVLISDKQMKVEEILEPISFPEMKAEPDEVSYMSLCRQYAVMARLFSGLCYLGLPT
jgi:hypothetical protein